MTETESVLKISYIATKIPSHILESNIAEKGRKLMHRNNFTKKLTKLNVF